MKVKLHRCRNVWLKVGAHPCWRVQRELNKAGVQYEVVKDTRDAIEQLSGQRNYPVIEFAPEEIYVEDPKAMAARIKAGMLLGARGQAHALAHPNELHEMPLVAEHVGDLHDTDSL